MHLCSVTSVYAGQHPRVSPLHVPPDASLLVVQVPSLPQHAGTGVLPAQLRLAEGSDSNAQLLEATTERSWRAKLAPCSVVIAPTKVTLRRKRPSMMASICKASIAHNQAATASTGSLLQVASQSSKQGTWNVTPSVQTFKAAGATSIQVQIIHLMCAHMHGHDRDCQISPCIAFGGGGAADSVPGSVKVTYKLLFYACGPSISSLASNEYHDSYSQLPGASVPNFT